jgi:hypothetical protein
MVQQDPEHALAVLAELTRWFPTEAACIAAMSLENEASAFLMSQAQLARLEALATSDERTDTNDDDERNC